MLAREHVIVDPKEHFLHIENAYRGARDSVCLLLRHFEELYADEEGIIRVPKGMLAATAGACEAISDGLERIEITHRVIRNTEHLTAARRGCKQLQQNIAAGLPESLPHEMVTATVKNVQAFLDAFDRFTREAPGIPDFATNPQTGGPKRVVDVDSVEANRPWRQANRPLSAQTRDGLRARMRNSDFYDTASPESATSQAAKPSAPKPAAAGDSEEGVGAAEGDRISAKGWKPPLGYVGVKTICSDERFRKNGKNPARTTIHAWIKCGQRTGIPVSVLKAPDSQEVHVPENWVMDQISTWNPRT